MRCVARRDDSGLAFRTDAALEASAGRPWVLPAVLLVALALRVAHLLWFRDSPFVAALTLDARFYDQWAQRIAAGEWVGGQAFWVDPLYAYVLGVAYTWAGHELWLPRLLNLACGVATVWLVARVAGRAWGSRAAAVAAALCATLFVPAIHFEAQVEKTALSVLLLAVALDAFLIGTTRAVLVAGLALGLTVLARGNALAFVPLAALTLVLGWDREPGDPLIATARHRWRRAGLLLAGALPCIALATAHNWAASGALVPTTTNLGINLYLGNHAGNQYGYYEPPDFLQPNTESERPDFRAEAERRGAGTLADPALSAYWTSAAWQAVLEAPGLAVQRTARKLLLALNGDEIPDSEDVAIVAAWSPVLRAPLLWFGQLLPLAALGALLGRRRRAVRILAAVAVVYLASLLPFFIMARLRVQILPPLAVLAGGTLAWAIAALRARQGRPLALGAAVVGAVALIAWYQPAWMAERRVGSLAIGWHNLGAGFADRGQRAAAIDAFSRAAAINPAAVPASLRMLATYQREDGDYPRAEETLRQLVAVRPDSRSARAALDSLYQQMLSDPRWRDDAGLARRRAAFAGGGSGSAPRPAAMAPAAPPPVRQLDGAAAERLRAALAGQPAAGKAWIVFDSRDAAARALAGQLGAGFAAAGWPVHGPHEARFPLRSGLFVLAADDEPSPAAAAATAALDAAQLPATVASGYRAYAADRRRVDPNWTGFEFAPEQEFVIAVGRPSS
jgi:4-amino-4-deoxy-L-arabinose transferase-like glycosyltransferase